MKGACGNLVSKNGRSVALSGYGACVRCVPISVSLSVSASVCFFVTLRPAVLHIQSMQGLMCVCVYVCMCVCVYACMCVCVLCECLKRYWKKAMKKNARK